MATQTETYKLNKPARTDKIGIDLLNENMDIIERELKKCASDSAAAKASFYDIDLTGVVAVDFDSLDSAEYSNSDLAESVDGAALLAALSSGCAARVKFYSGANESFVKTVILGSRTSYDSDEGRVTRCDGILPVGLYNAYEIYSLVVVVDDSGTYTIIFYAYRHLNGVGTVKTVNGVEPDENGNVEVPTAEGTVKFVNGIAPDETGNAVLLSTTGLSIDWVNGTYTETLSDGTSHTEDIEFNANGVPTKFGSMAFSITGG